MAPTDKKTDRPIDEIKILSTEVFVDPYPDAEKALAAAREKVFQRRLFGIFKILFRDDVG